MLVLAIATPTDAGHEPTEVASYSGCVNPAGGLSNLAEGDTTTAPCPPGQVEIHLSGGDITDVTAGTGLAGGATDGSASLALAPSYQLPQECIDADVAKWDGSAWICGADDDTTYTAGSGLSLIDGEFSVDTSQVQARVSGTCEGGSINAIADDGTVTCQQLAVAGGGFDGAACTAFAPGSGVVVAAYDEFGLLTGTRCVPTTPDAFEPNDTREQASDLQRFGSFHSHDVEANIVPAGNDDWYETNTTCSENLVLNTTRCDVRIELSGPGVEMQVFVGEELVEPTVQNLVITGSSGFGFTNGVIAPVTVHIRVFSAEQRPYHLRLADG